MNVYDTLAATPPPPALSEAAPASDHDKLARAAQDFESLLLTRLLNEMKETVGTWSGEKDSATRQIHGLFWMQMAQTLADQGGLGLGRQMLDALESPTAANPTPQLDTAL